MRGPLGKVLMWVAAIVLIPVVLAGLHTFAAYGIGGVQDRTWLWLLYGMGVFILLFIFLRTFIIGYLFSKDPVRKIWGWITGYEPPRSREGQKKPKAEERPTWLVRMAPFFFPIYTIIAVLAIWVLSFLDIDVSPKLTAFIIGLTYMFHVFEVGHDMKARHPDLEAGNLIFNVEIIILVNIQVLVILMWVALGSDLNWLEFNGEFLDASADWVTDTGTAVKRLFGMD